jgi:hypothetical protein
MVIPAPLVRKVQQRAVEAIERLAQNPDAADREAAYEAVELAQKLGRLDMLLPCREKLIPLFQKDQDPQTGLWPRNEWHAPLVPAILHVPPLKMLGGRPTHPVRAIERVVASTGSVREWLDGLDWAWPWGGPTGAGHGMISLTFSAADLGLITVAQLEIIREKLEAGRDDVYGVWHRDHFTKPEVKQLGGAFAFGIVYARFRWPLLRPEGAIRMLEELQRPTGSWSDTWPAGSTDMDAAWMIDRYTSHDAALRARAMPMLERVAEYSVARLSDPADFAKAALHTNVNLLSVLRKVFPDPQDDVQPWEFVMFAEGM